jgi:WD40 repeat protein
MLATAIPERYSDELLELAGHADGVNSVAWSPDGSRIATASEIIRIWIEGSFP